MPRPKGSKVFSCPKCGERVIAVPGESGICGSCGAKTKLTKVLMAAQKPIARKPAGKKAAPVPAKAPTPAAEPKKRGRKPAVKVIEKPKAEKKRGRPPVVVETKKRGRPPVAPAPAPEPKKRGRKPGSKKEAPNPQHIAPRILPPPKKTSK